MCDYNQLKNDIPRHIKILLFVVKLSTVSLKKLPKYAHMIVFSSSHLVLQTHLKETVYFRKKKKKKKKTTQN